MPRSSTSGSEPVEVPPPRPVARPAVSGAPISGPRRRGALRWAVLAVVVALLAGEGAARALEPLPPDRTWPDAESQWKADHAASVAAAGGREDLIVAGSSVTDAALDPTMILAAGDLDGTGYSYAQEGSPAVTTARFLRAAVLDQVRPETVVIGLDPGDIGAVPGRIEALDRAMRASRGYRLAAGTPTLADRIADAAARRSALVAHRQLLRDPYRLWLERGEEGPPAFLDPTSGALLRHRDEAYVPPPADYGRGRTSPPGELDRQIGALDDLIADLHERGVRVVVVELPQFRRAYEPLVGAAALARSHDAVTALTDRRCADHLDLRDEAQDQRFWADTSHVNGAGTALLSAALGEWLAEHPTARTGC